MALTGVSGVCKGPNPTDTTDHILLSSVSESAGVTLDLVSSSFHFRASFLLEMGTGERPHLTLPMRSSKEPPSSRLSRYKGASCQVGGPLPWDLHFSVSQPSSVPHLLGVGGRGRGPLGQGCQLQALSSRTRDCKCCPPVHYLWPLPLESFPLNHAREGL